MQLYDLNLMAATVMIFRLIMIPMILYNLSYSWTGLRDLFRGQNNPTIIYRCQLFFGCLALLGFQTVALTKVEEVGSGPWTLLFVLLFTLMNIAAIFGRRLNQEGAFDTFMWIYQSDYLKTAARSVKVSGIDAEIMEHYLQKAELEALDRLIGHN